MPDPVTFVVNEGDPAFLYLALHPQEEIKAIVRRSIFGFFGTIGLVLGMAIVPIILFLAAQIFFQSHFDQVRQVFILLVSSFYLFLLTFLFGAWINYYYDIIFITSERIINVTQKGLLARETSELGLNQIEDVTAQIEGFFPSLFNYGLLVVETAGEGTADGAIPGMKGYFTIPDAPDPNRLARLIIDLHRQSDNDDSS